LRRSLQIQTQLFTTTTSKERERERDEGDDGEKSSGAFVANDDHRRLGEQSARRNRRRRDE
jgi:hypothetical protein